MNRRTPLGRGSKGLSRGTGLDRGARPLARTRWEPKARKPLPARSPRRIAEAPARDQTRAIVLARDGVCIAVDLVPEVTCGSPDPRQPALEVDELRGGAYRCTEYLDPDRCNTLCQLHHDWKTDHKREFIRRLDAAREKG